MIHPPKAESGKRKAKMRTMNRTQSMAPTLEDLLNDNRLGRLFSKDIRDCALQLWILQGRFQG
ncbi:protein of unknown function (plasmid) [Caballeronia sp. S22]